MPPPSDRKLYLGPKLRQLRRELGINQSQMAGELRVSPSYLNHLERNQRPLTAQMLLRLADTYDIDIRSFVASATAEATTGLRELFSDPLLKDISLPRDEVMELTENYPGVVEAVTRIYRALNDLRRLPEALDRIGDADRAGSTLGWLRDYVQQHRNHFPEIDAAAEAVAGELPDEPEALSVGLRERLQQRHATSVRIADERTMGGALRFYDYHRRRLMLSERLPAPGRLFALAHQLAAAELAEPIAAMVPRAGAEPDAAGLLKAMLINYAAAALVMPYGRFHRAAAETRHDLDILQARFGVSFEQLAHRLATLGRASGRGVPFFMLKVDNSGTVSKRFSGEGVPLAQFGGGCPRWSLYRAFQAPGRTITEIVEMPDGARYLTVTRTITDGPRDPASRSLSAIALGCDIKYAAAVTAADGLTGVNPIGPACHLCERPDCPDRALPPITRSLEVSPNRRGRAPYPFRAI